MRPSSKFVHDGRLLILDTGVFRELATFRAVHEFHFAKLESDLRFIKDEPSYKHCGEFIGRFRERKTSPSVVAELHYWIRRTDADGRIKLWNRVYDEFLSMSISEEAVQLTGMDVRQVARLGPVDVSLIEIARRNTERSPCILTVDNTLCGVCEKAGIRAFSIQEATSTPLAC